MKINKNMLVKNIWFLGLLFGYLVSFILGSYAYAQIVPGPFSISGSGCWLTPSPGTEVNFFGSSGATDYAANRRIFGSNSWTRIISSVNNLLPGQGPIRLTDNGDLDDYTVSAGNTYEYQIIAINSSGQTTSWNTAVIQVSQANCSPPPPACMTSFSPTSILPGGTTTQSWTSSSDADGSLSYSCSGNLGSGTLSANGSRTVSPTLTQTCTMTAVSSNGTSASCGAGITVATPTPTPSIGPSPTPADIVPPVITNVRITNITATSATVMWNTDEQADSQVEFCVGFNRCGVNTALAVQMITSHSVDLSGLTSATTYSVWVKSRDGAGNLGTLGYFLFKTLTQSTPTPSVSPTVSPTQTPTSSAGPANQIIISNIQISNITRDSAHITWDTDRPADSKIFSCTFGLFCFNSLLNDPNLTISHSFTVSGLKANRNYYIQITSADISGGQGSSLTSWKTKSGLIISNVRITNTTQSSATVSWDTDYPANSGMIVCRIFIFCYFSAPLTDPAIVTTHSMTVSNLNPGTTYYYQVLSMDPLGYSARSGLSSFKTP